jgi:hypothetical protein
MDHRIHHGFGGPESNNEPAIMMNSSLSFSHVDLSPNESARYGSGEGAPSKAGIKAPRNIHFSWTSFDEFIEKASPILAAIYLSGALRFTAVLVYNAFVY